MHTVSGLPHRGLETERDTGLRGWPSNVVLAVTMPRQGMATLSRHGDTHVQEVMQRLFTDMPRESQPGDLACSVSPRKRGPHTNSTIKYETNERPST